MKKVAKEYPAALLITECFAQRRLLRSAEAASLSGGCFAQCRLLRTRRVVRENIARSSAASQHTISTAACSHPPTDFITHERRECVDGGHFTGSVPRSLVHETRCDGTPPCRRGASARLKFRSLTKHWNFSRQNASRRRRLRSLWCRHDIKQQHGSPQPPPMLLAALRQS